MKRAARLLISGSYFAGMSLWRALRMLAGRKLPGSCVVLYYHHVSTASRARFAHQMDVLKKMAIPLAANFTGPLEPGVRYAIVSFDDGYQSVVDNAIPELKKRGIPSVFFIPTRYIGRYPGWEIDSAYKNDMGPIVTAEQLKQLSDESVIIGSHTVSHVRLATCSADGARKELTDSKMHLESILGKDVTLFSFPYGGSDPDIVALALESGYSRIFTSVPQVTFGDSIGVEVGRFSVIPSESLVEIKLKLSGAYAWQYEYQKIINRLIPK